jgi:hypothetical protein
MANIVYDKGIRNAARNVARINYFRYSGMNEEMILKCNLNKQVLKYEIYLCTSGLRTESCILSL